MGRCISYPHLIKIDLRNNKRGIRKETCGVKKIILN
jgi:hypothetical protein